MSDWDAGRYHRLSDPQLGWGRAVVARLEPAEGERVLDVGCGTGRLTSEIASRPGMFVIGLDRSSSMLSEAAHRAGPPHYVRGDAAALPFVAAFDAVVSTATFHWVPDHDRLFRAIDGVLRPGGRLVAQCGGGPNLARLLDRARVLMGRAPYARFFAGWADPWYFADVPETERRLGAAGLVDIAVSLEPAPTSFADAAAFADFISCVCVRHHVERLPAPERETFVEALANQASTDDPPFTLDYWRLNIAGRKRPS
jgi:trans-aconitate 2-methyltransferase